MSRSQNAHTCMCIRPRQAYRQMGRRSLTCSIQTLVHTHFGGFMESRHRDAAHPDQTRRDVTAMSYLITFLASFLPSLLRILHCLSLFLMSSTTCYLSCYFTLFFFAACIISLFFFLFYIIHKKIERDLLIEIFIN